MRGCEVGLEHENGDLTTDAEFGLREDSVVSSLLLFLCRIGNGDGDFWRQIEKVVGAEMEQPGKEKT